MNMPGNAQFLVFSDLDGSLLDHHTYSYLDAQPQLHHLDHLRIPMIPATSKTRAEIQHLRTALGNDGPFIVENGAAVFIPEGYFEGQPPDTVTRDGFWVREIAAPRAQWLELLEELSDSFAEEFDYFFRAGTAGIMRMTNLPEARAEESNRREYSEPVKWLGTDERRAEFVATLQQRGACVLAGGRFLAVSGDCDKGRALLWLREIYRQSRPGQSCHDLAIGDSANDIGMLQAAETALVVRSPVHDFPPLQRSEGVIYSTGYGPAGWAEGVMRWLHTWQ